MDSHGRLGNERLAIAGTEFAPGDRIVCLRNSDTLTVKNGTRATVNSIDCEQKALSAVTDRGARVQLDGRYLSAGHVRHAYALTGHAGQGITVERAFVLGTGGHRLQEWGYVALSRAREETRLYVTAIPRERESHFHDLDDRDPVTRLGQALEESAIERLAVDQRPLPSGPLHDTRAEIERRRPTAELRVQLRHLEQQRLALTKARQEAERTLDAAAVRLNRGGLLNRGRRREQTLDEIGHARTAIKAADSGLTTLAAEIRELRTPPPTVTVSARAVAEPSVAELAREPDGASIDL
jgi:hypothetical protein